MFRPAHHSPSSSRKTLRALLVAAGALSALGSAQAATVTFTGTTDTNWSTSTNWNGGTVPASGNDIIIDDTTANNVLLLNDGTHTIGHLTFGATGTRTTPFTIVNADPNLTYGLIFTGGLTANGNFATKGIDQGLLFRVPVTIAQTQTWTIAGADGWKSDPGTGGGDYGVAIGRNNKATGTINSLTLNGDLIKQGSGMLVIAGTNVTGSGNIIVNQGTLKLNGGETTDLKLEGGAGQGNITVNSGAALLVYRNSGVITLSRNIILNDGATLKASNGSAAWDIASNIALNGQTIFEVANQYVRFTGNLNLAANSSLTFNASANATITGSSIFGNASTILGKAGGSSLTITGALSNFTGGLAIAGNGAININGATNLDITPFTSVTFNGASAFAQIIAGTKPISINAATSTAAIDFTGANTFTGDITITSGRLRFLADNLGNASNKIIFDGTPVDIMSANNTGNASIQQRLGQDIQIASTHDIVINSGKEGTFYTWGSYTITVDSIISGGGRLRKEDGGTLLLNKANTYTGGTVIANGVVKLGIDNALGTGPLAITATGGSLDLNGKTQTVSDFTHNLGTVSNGTLTLAGAWNPANFSGSFDTLTVNATASGTHLAGGVTINSGLGTTVNFGAITSGTGSLNLLGTGVFKTTNTNNGDGILGYWATRDNKWATVNGSGEIIALGDEFYSNSGQWQASKHTVVGSGNIDQSSYGDVSTISLTFSEAAAYTVQLGASNSGTISSGQIFVSSSVAGNASVISGGTLKGSATDGLVVNQSNTNASGTLTISSIIANNGASSNLVKTGTGTLIVTGANTFTGQTIVNAGVLQIGPTTSNTVSVNMGSSIIVNDGAILNFARLHASTTQNITWTTSSIALTDGSTLRFQAQTGSNQHTLGSAISVSGDVLINNNGGSYNQNITLTGALSGTGTINYQVTTNSGSQTGAPRELSLSHANNTFSGNWVIDYTITSTDDFATFSSKAVGALGTGKVTLQRRALLTNGINGGLDSLSEVIVQQSTAKVNVGDFTWNNTNAILTLQAGEVNIGDSTVTLGTVNATAGKIQANSGKTAVFSATKGSIVSGVLADSADATGKLSLAKVSDGTSGGGTLVITGSQTYTGNTTINGGILQLGSGSTNGSLASTNITINGGKLQLGDGTASGTLADNAVATINSGGTLTLNGPANFAHKFNITGAGIVSKEGTGSNILQGTNNAGFTGGIAVNAGTLSVRGQSQAGYINITAGGVLDINQNAGTLTLSGATKSSAGHASGMSGAPANDITGSLQLSNNHTLSVGAASSVEVLKISQNLVLNGGGLDITFAGAGNLDTLQLGGTLIVQGTANVINLNATSTLTVGNHDLILFGSQGSLTQAALDNVQITGLGAMFTGKLQLESGKVVLQLMAAGEDIVWDGTAGAPEWNTTGTNTNWKNGASSVAFADGGLVTFNDVAAQKNVSITSTVQPGSITVEGTSDYTFTNTSGGKIAGMTSLTKNGTGTLTLTTDSATSLNEFTGAVVITGGTIKLDAGSTGAVLIADAGTASLLGKGQAGAAGIKIDGGTLHLVGTATTTTNRSFTIGANGATIKTDGGHLFFNGTSAIALEGVTARTLTLDAPGNITIANAIADTAGATLAINKTGAGTLVLQGESTFAGSVTVTGGKLALKSDAALGNAANALSLNGTTLTNAYTTSTVADTAADVTLAATRTITVGASGVTIDAAAGKTFTINSKITGTGNIAKITSGTLVLGSSTSDYTGTTTISAGTLELAGAAILANGGVASAIGKSASAAANLTFGAGTTLKLTPTVKAITDRSFTINGDFTINANSSATNTVVVFNGATAIANGSTANSTLTLTGVGGAGAYSGTTMQNATNGVILANALADNGANKLSINKTGTGTWVLTGNNTFTGDIAISGGMLSVGSVASLGTGNITLTNGAILGNLGAGDATGTGNNLLGTGTGLTLASTRTITLGTGGGMLRSWSQAFVVQGTITGAGKLTKVDTGRLTLSGANTFQGGLEIAGGQVQITNAAALPHGASAGNVTITTGTLELAGVSVTVNGLSGAGTVQNVTASTTATLTIGDNNATSTYSGTLANGAGTLALTKTGTGTLTLSGTNTYTGNTAINAGIVQAASAAALGTSNVTLASGTTLELMGAINVSVRTLAGDGTVRNGVANSTATLTLGGSNDTFTVAAKLTNGTLSNAVLALTKAGTGELTLSNTTNDFTGAINVNAGSLKVTSVAALGAGAAINVASGGMLNLNGQAIGATKTVTIAGTGVSSNGAIYDSAGGGSIAKIALSASATVGTLGNTTLTSVTGTGDLTLTGSAPGYVLGGTGATIANSGQLILKTTLSSSATAGTINPATGILIDGGELVSSTSDLINTANKVSLAGTGKLTFNGTGLTQTLTQLNGTSGTVGTAAGSSATLTINSTSDSSYSGLIQGSINLVKTGTGTWTLGNSANTYTGTTTINGGTLKLTGALATSGNDVLGNAANTAATQLVINGGTLLSDIAGASTTNRLFTIGANGATLSSNNGALQFTGTGNIAYDPSATNITLTLDGASVGENKLNLNITDTSGGTASLVKTGAGNWIIGGANTYTGTTTIANGTLSLGANNAVSTASALTLGNGTTSGTLNLNGYNQTLRTFATQGTGNSIINSNATASTLTIDLSADQTLNAALGGTGNNLSLVKTGAGKLTLAGTTSYTGTTTIQTGTLALANDGVLGSNTITLYTGALLDVTGLSGGLTLGTGKELIAGFDGTNPDLRGDFIFAGGELTVGGTKTTVTDANNVLSIDGSLTLNASTLNYTFTNSAAGANSTVKVTNLNLSGTTTIDPILDISSGLVPGKYTIFSYSSFVGDVANLVYGPTIDPRYRLSFGNDTVAGQIYMQVESRTGDNPLTWVGNVDSGSGVYEWGRTKNNFIDDSEPPVAMAFYPGDNAIFNDSASNFDVTVSTGGILIGAVTFDNSTHDYTVSGDTIGGDGYIEKRGSGKLTLLGENTYAGAILEDGTRSAGTILSGGTIAVGHDRSLGTSSMLVIGGTLQSIGSHTLANNVVISNGGSFTLDSSTGDIKLTGTLSGNSNTTVTKIGAGTVSLTGDGSGFSGLLNHTQGTLALGAIDHSQAKYSLTGAGTTLDAISIGDQTIKIGQLTGEAGTILQTSTTGTKTFEIGALNTDSIFAGQIQDNADIVALTKVGTGALVLTGHSSNTGEITVRGGLLQVGNDTDSSLGTGAITIDSGATLAFYTTGDLTLGQLITSQGTLEKKGTNTLTLSQDNLDLAGTVLISDGILALTANGTLGTAELVNNAALILNRTGDYTLANTITGQGTITKQDAGTLTYLGNNTATGVTTVNNGTLQLGDNTTAQAQTYTPTIQLAGGTTLQLAPANGGTTTLSTVAGTGTVNQTGNGTSILTGTLQASQVGITAGTLQLGSGSEKTALDVTAPVSLGTNGTLLVSRTGDTRLSGQLSGDGNLVLQGDKNGSGTLVIANAANQLTGTVTVQKRSILQIGDANTQGSLNASGNALTVDLGQRATLRYTNAGTETGADLVLTGTGTLDYNGGNTLRFNSDASAFAGTIQASHGTMLLDAAQLPTATLNAVDTGHLQVQADADTTLTSTWGSGNGTIQLAAANVSQPVTYQIDSASTFGGTLAMADHTTLQLAGHTVGAKTLALQSGALLRGNGTIQGDLHNQLGGTVHPGNSVGQINITGNFLNDGKVILDVDSAESHSTIHYSGTAQLNTSGALQMVLTQDTYDALALGTELKILVDDNTADGLSSIVGNFDLSKVTLLVDGTTLNGKALTYNKGDGGLTLLLASSIRDIPGLNLHDGLDGYVDYLDNILHNPTDYPEQVNTISGFLGAPDISSAINNASPIGLASMTAMTTAIAHDDAETLRAHLESLRYQRGEYGQEINTMPYIVGTGFFLKNGSGNSDPAFDFNTYGGLIGVDQSFGHDFLLGMNVGYHVGKADLHNGGGKITLNNASLNFYGSYMISDWLYLDASLFGGYNSYEVKQDTMYGRATAKPEGFNYGGTAYLGTIIPLSKQFHLTPYAGFEYVRSDVDAFTEKGTQSALHLDSFTQDSLRAKIGTGLNWLVPTNADFTLRLGLNAAFAHELLDDEVDLEARFANDTSGNKYKVGAAASPENLVQIGPMVELGLTENTALSFGYTFEYDFKEQTAHHLNATFRMRF